MSEGLSDKADRVARELGLGATGKYPHGKLTSRPDEGELKAAISIEEGKIVVVFGKAAAFLAMTSSQARAWADLLVKWADKLEAGE